jgi:hypothetical protein
MEYLLPDNSPRYRTSEPINLYEIDLVRQWLNISPGTIIETINSGKITVINAGFRNKHEGPDIKNAILLIKEKVVNGPIECHISTSDWCNHRHHQNPTYDSVILHVVRKVNKGILKPVIPTILIRPNNYCSNECSLNNFNKSSNLYSTILHNTHMRWLDKINVYNGHHDNQENLIKLLIQNSFKILGAGGNENHLVKLAKNINFEKFQSLNMHESEKYLWNINERLKINWVKRGIRPAQQPQNRMKLAIELVKLLSNINFNTLPSLNKIKSLVAKDLSSDAGKGIQTELLGNIFIPFYAARALYLYKTEDYQKYYEIWTNLKLPNSYRKFEKRFDTILLSKQLKIFSVLQGLIALDKSWCTNNLCNLCPLKEKNYVNS